MKTTILRLILFLLAFLLGKYVFGLNEIILWSFIFVYIFEPLFVEWLKK